MPAATITSLFISGNKEKIITFSTYNSLVAATITSCIQMFHLNASFRRKLGPLAAITGLIVVAPTTVTLLHLREGISLLTGLGR